MEITLNLVTSIDKFVKCPLAESTACSDTIDVYLIYTRLQKRYNHGTYRKNCELLLMKIQSSYQVHILKPNSDINSQRFDHRSNTHPRG